MSLIYNVDNITYTDAGFVGFNVSLTKSQSWKQFDPSEKRLKSYHKILNKHIK